MSRVDSWVGTDITLFSFSSFERYNAELLHTSNIYDI